MEHDDQATRRLLKGAFFLTVAGVLSKLLSAGYRIPLQNITGDLGFYIYQQIYPFLGIATMLSLYGFPAAISKLVAERKETGQPLSIQSFYLPLLFSMSIFCTLLSIGLYLNSGQIALQMGDVQLREPLRVAAFIFLLVPIPSLLRGVFQGLHNMRPTAISQVVEQAIRVSAIIIVAILLSNNGGSLYRIGAYAAFSSMLGTIFASFFLIVVWLKTKSYSLAASQINWTYYTKTILFHGLLMSFNYMLLLFLQFVDAFTLVTNLVDYGYNLEEAKRWKGIYDRGQPLIQLGMVLGSSLALALIPSVTKKRLEQHPNLFRLHIQSALKVSLFISIGAATGLFVIFPYANALLFQQDIGTTSLRILMVTILFGALSITISSILQGLGHVYITAAFVLTAVVVKWVLNPILVTYYGIGGSAVATVAAVFVACMLNFIYLKRTLRLGRIFVVPWRSLGISLIAMVLFLIGFNRIVGLFFNVSDRGDYFVYVLVVSIIGGLLYLGILIISRSFTNVELQSFPLGTSLLRIGTRRKSNETNN
ncbi:putative polysaccharide biosynthesis protein [Terrihalobacillus insolitus]|uniref:putative polysaccharide biosynthesis protein n=1 Tax=Terrihalobacillus insolitus TaxID=2950438 RepID=UPI00234115A3|nr:polysaccharide biosynthesis protein [Terrihalobacillus insolitus]MDC3414862.1 polysaccharide biosynthesis protein [Terrihalobacillus insolitus]